MVTHSSKIESICTASDYLTNDINTIKSSYDVTIILLGNFNCNHKLSSRWSHINAATSGMGGSVW